MRLGFGNNVKAALAADITATQTTLPVIPGTGASFAALLEADEALKNPSYQTPCYAKLTLSDKKETAFEICHLVKVNGDTLTVLRGQEGTLARG